MSFNLRPREVRGRVTDLFNFKENNCEHTGCWKRNTMKVDNRYISTYRADVHGGNRFHLRTMKGIIV